MKIKKLEDKLLYHREKQCSSKCCYTPLRWIKFHSFPYLHYKSKMSMIFQLGRQVENMLEHGSSSTRSRCSRGECTEVLGHEGKLADGEPGFGGKTLQKKTKKQKKHHHSRDKSLRGHCTSWCRKVQTVALVFEHDCGEAEKLNCGRAGLCREQRRRRSNLNQIQIPTESPECDWGDPERNVNLKGDRVCRS